jgi:DNA-binding GntR family transcriptional regulator
MDLGKIAKGEFSPAKAPSQPLSDRIHDYLREAIIENDLKPRNIFLGKDIYDRLERNENEKEEKNE